MIRDYEELRRLESFEEAHRKYLSDVKYGFNFNEYPVNKPKSIKIRGKIQTQHTIKGK